MRILLFIIGFLIALQAQAQRDSLLHLVWSKGSFDTQFHNSLQTNSALKFRGQQALTTLQFTTKQRLQNEQLISYKGKDQQHYGFSAQSNISFKKIMFWGAANYSNETTENKNWCLVANPERVYPYYITDTVGGSSYAEKYAFSGGINFDINRSAVGFEVQYKAEHHHGKTDPRPLNRVFDMEVKLGYVCRISGYTNLGLSFLYNTYRQFTSVNSFREDRKDYFYFLRGFGQYHHKLSGTESQTSLKYFGNSFGTAFDWSNTKAKTHVRLSAQTQKTEQIHSNVYIPFYTNDLLLEGVIAKAFQLDNKTLILKTLHNLTRRKGTEVLFERVRVNEERAIYEWIFLTSSQRFKVLQNVSQLDICLISSNKKFEQSFNLNASLLQKKENFLEPNLNFSYSAFLANWKHSLRFKKENTNVSLSYGFAYKHMLNQQMNLAQTNRLEQVFLQDIENEMQNAYQTHLSVRIDFKLRETVLSIRPRASYTNIGEANIWNLSLTTGVII